MNLAGDLESDCNDRDAIACIREVESSVELRRGSACRQRKGSEKVVRRERLQILGG